MSEQAFRKFLIESAFEIADNIPEILSMNIVGSFAESDDLSSISDIDTVTIVDYMTEWTFKSIMAQFEQLGIEISDRFGYKLKINNTFGPLKYNEEKTVVYHLMIYDVSRHINHCRKSPFTCFDWQRTDLFTKSHISDIYKVHALMPHHFFNARRSVGEYLSDYKSSKISYRYYRFNDGEVFEEVDYKPMSLKDKYEFAFHIINFVMLNFLKMIKGDNKRFSRDVLLEDFGTVFPTLKEELQVWFPRLKSYKDENEFPEDTTSLDVFLEGFLTGYEKIFYRIFPEDQGTVEFVRHAKTESNQEGFFLGQKLDPPILPESVSDLNYNKQTRIHCSPSLRTRQSAELLCPEGNVETDTDLKEIDYGKAEGHDLSWLENNHPEIIEEWNRGGDPEFPAGESQSGVLKRVLNFTGSLKPGSPGISRLVVTHNVWLRCLLGTWLHLPPSEWYQLRIPHLVNLNFRYNPTGGLLIDIPQTQLEEILRSLDWKNFLEYQKKQDNNIQERQNFWRQAFDNSRNVSKSTAPVHEGACLIPMAGDGKRFREYGFTTSKPLISVDGKKMILQAQGCLPTMKKNIFMVRDNVLNQNLESTLKASGESVHIVPVEKLTEGQASTCMLGIDFADPEKPLQIAPCDNGMYWNEQGYLETLQSAPDLICWTFTRHLCIPAKPEAWGYVSVDDQNFIKAVSVKKPFTDDPFNEHCIIGTFWFKTATLFKSLAEELIDSDMRVNNEFYVDSIMGLAADKGLKVKIFPVDYYLSWGKPEDLFEYRKWRDITEIYPI